MHRRMQTMMTQSKKIMLVALTVFMLLVQGVFAVHHSEHASVLDNHDCTVCHAVHAHADVPTSVIVPQISYTSFSYAPAMFYALPSYSVHALPARSPPVFS